nr:Pr6Pr family membrane protein [Sphingomonas sp.]
MIAARGREGGMADDAVGKAGRTAAGFGRLLGLAALALQAGLTIPAGMANGLSLGGAILFYLSFFTILSNGVLAAVHLATAGRAPALAVLRRPAVRAGMMAAMLFVMAFYHFVLAASWAPAGWFKVADVALHYATPLHYAGWWLIFAPHGRTSWRSAGAMAAWPFAYALYAIARGAVVGEYPYPVLDAAALGYGRVAANVAGLLALFLVLCLAVIAADRRLGAVSRR